MTPPSQNGLSTIEDVIADAKAGKLFILVDDEDRENEGDLCVVGECATADAINFMAKYGRGLICLALTRQRTEHLGLSMMERRNESRHETAFTVSIEAREGVTTGNRRMTGRIPSKPPLIRHVMNVTSPHPVISSHWWRVMVGRLCGLDIPKLLSILRALPGLITRLALSARL